MNSTPSGKESPGLSPDIANGIDQKIESTEVYHVESEDRIMPMIPLEDESIIICQGPGTPKPVGGAVLI